MKNNNVMIAFGLLLCMHLQASDSPKTISNNFSNENLLSKNKIKEIDMDDADFYDAESGFEEILSNEVPLLQSKDIEALDQYSGVDKYFDDLYKFAKRDLYLAQQNEKLFPDKVHSYENLKKYYGELKKQRKEMAEIKQAISQLMNKKHRMLDMKNFESDVQSQITDLDLQVQKIFNNNAQRPSNQKMLVDYKVPYEPQLQINKLKLLQARIILNALQ